MIAFEKIYLNRSSYFFNDIKDIDASLLRINKIYTRNTDAVVYEIKYIIMQSINYQNVDREIHLCLSFSNVDAYVFEESGNKYLIFALTKNNKKVLELHKKTLE